MGYGEAMRVWLTFFLTLLPALAADIHGPAPVTAAARKVYVLPIREAIMPPLVYLVRRGVKEAMESGADLLVVDMETPGGRLDTCREIISILGQFSGDTVTYVNKEAFSAGAFVAVATKRIYMAPQSVIGAAAPMIMNPTGDGIAQIPETVEKKMTSAVRAMVRRPAVVPCRWRGARAVRCRRPGRRTPSPSARRRWRRGFPNRTRPRRRRALGPTTPSPCSWASC